MGGDISTPCIFFNEKILQDAVCPRSVRLPYSTVCTINPNTLRCVITLAHFLLPATVKRCLPFTLLSSTSFLLAFFWPKLTTPTLGLIASHASHFTHDVISQLSKLTALLSRDCVDKILRKKVLQK
jgi:hypothetical protein